MGLSERSIVSGNNTVLSFVFQYEFLFHNALTACVYTISS